MQKVQKRTHFISETARDKVISAKLFTHRGYSFIYPFLPQIVFPTFSTAILKFFIKLQNAFISEMVWDRAISTEFFIHRDYAEPSGTFCQKSFCLFWHHLQFRHNTQDTVIWHFFQKKKKTFQAIFSGRLNFSINAKIYLTDQDAHISKNVNAHWDTVFAVQR